VLNAECLALLGKLDKLGAAAVAQPVAVTA
jgi:hypothetical protein